MRYYQLFEYNSSKTLINYREPLESRLEGDSRAKAVLGTKPTPEAALRHLEAIDPSKKKAFVLNLLNWYIDGSMRFIEDAYKAKDVFPLYTKFRNRDDVPHISKLSFADFLDLGDRLNDTKSGAELDKEEELAFYKSGQAELFKDTDEVKIVIPKTKEAAIYFGRNTKWCTSATNGNAFNQYKGPLYIFLFKKENKRWQFEFDSKQFMDEKDKRLITLDVYQGFKLLNMSDEDVIKQDADMLKYISDPSEKVQLIALRTNGSAIKHIENPSTEFQRIAVQQIGRAVYYIKNPSEEVKRLAVQQDGNSIGFIKEPSEELKILAVKNRGYAIRYITNPSEEMKTLAVKQNYYAIRYIPFPSLELQKLAVQQNGNTIRCINEPSEEVKKLAVQNEGDAIKYIKNPSEELQIAAVTKDPNAIYHIDNPTERAQQLAVMADPMMIRYIEKPSEEVQKIAIKKYGHAIMFIKNPSDEIIRFADNINKN